VGPVEIVLTSPSAVISAIAVLLLALGYFLHLGVPPLLEVVKYMHERKDARESPKKTAKS
jgi:hypothetical protein